MAKQKKDKTNSKLYALGSTGKAYEFNKPLEKKLKYQGKEVDIRLHEDPKGFSYIVWKNKKYMLDVVEKNQNRYTIVVNGVWHSFSVETPVSLKRKRYLATQADSSGAVSIEAPMPGKIIDIMVDEGSEVKEGEPILILEAMKMQNEIATHVAGTVKKISVRKNDTVMKDDILIEIQK